MPDGITTAPELRALLDQENAIRLETDRAILVSHVAREANVSEAAIVSSARGATVREKDARRLAVSLSPAWLGGVWSDVDLACFWGYKSNTAVAHARQTHRALMETDRGYRALAERVAIALKRERDRRTHA